MHFEKAYDHLVNVMTDWLLKAKVRDWGKKKANPTHSRDDASTR